MGPVGASTVMHNEGITSKLPAAWAREGALIAAARGGHEALVDDMLRAGAHPDQKEWGTGISPLHAACSLGHAAIVRSLLRGGAARNMRDSRGDAPLHLAAEKGHLSVVRALLAAGASVNRYTLGKMTALVLASRGGYADVVMTLIQHGADVNSCAPRSCSTALHEAAMGNHARCIIALIEAGANTEAAAWEGASKRTPLASAATSGSTAAVSALLTHGAAKNARETARRRTPLHLAIEGRHMSVVEVLSSAGADVSLSDGSGEGCLSLAVLTGHTNILKSLIKYGASVKAVSGSSRCSALHRAAQSNKVGMIDALVEAGADKDAQDVRGQTPLHYAANLHRCEALLALLRHGCNKDKTDSREQAALHVAAENVSPRAVVSLLTARVEVAARCGSEEQSAIDVAASMGGMRETKVLVPCGTDMNATTSKGETALPKAMSGNSKESIDVLTGMGALVDARDDAGVTPLMLATSDGEGSCATMRVLLEHGADVNAHDAGMKSPLHWAARSTKHAYTFLKTAEMLLEWEAEDMAVDANGLTALQVAEARGFSARGHSHGENHDGNIGVPLGVPEKVRRLFARAPAERKSRAWRRRRFPVLWRAHPGRFRPVEEVCQASSGGIEPRDCRDCSIKDREEPTVGNGGNGEGSRGGGADGVLAARVADLEEEGIFRNIVMFL